MKREAKCSDSSAAATSSSSDREDEQRALLETHDRQVDRLQISDRDDFQDNIYSRDYDSHRERRGTICRRPDPCASVDPREKKKCATKQSHTRYVS